MELNTIEDIDKAFPDEESARKYLANLRWGTWAQCPKCNNSKAYFIENGTRYKCANNKCYHKFSVKSNTLLMSSNLEFKTWIIAVWYFVKKRGRIEGFELSSVCDIKDQSGRTVSNIIDRLEFAWTFVNRELKGMDLFKNLFSKLFTLYEQYEQSEKISWVTGYHISDITDVNDQKQFNKLLLYCKRRLYFCKYIWLNFATPGEIMTEVYLFMYENKIKDYDATYLIKIINRTIARMWYQYQKDRPNLYIKWKDRNAELRKDAIRNLKKIYLVQVAKKTKEYANMSRGELNQSAEILNNIKERIKAKRILKGDLMDFESHFN